ncbi:MAG: hypothetical protein LBL87_07095 [Ruminococcus sp.]|jgi:hypothetical protein|nr:hypothetical protein [Ruminococcus sp.]
MRNINYGAVEKWLCERHLSPEEGFCERLKSYAKTAKKRGIAKTANDFYKMLGIRKEYISYWKYSDYSAQTKTKDKKK